MTCEQLLQEILLQIKQTNSELAIIRTILRGY